MAKTLDYSVEWIWIGRYLRYIYSWDELEEDRCDSVALLFGGCDALGRQEMAQTDQWDGYALHASC
jgi:hypothetical protein